MQNSPRLLIVVPWLQGGGAQAALEGLVRDLEEPPDLLILFEGSRNYEPLLNHFNKVFELQESKGALGVLRAARLAARRVAQYERVYSLLRGSHLVLGLLPVSTWDRVRLAASFHQLPSEDESSRLEVLASVVVKRATKRAELVTAPSRRAVRELVDRGFGDPDRVRFEPNVVRARLAPIRTAQATEPVRLLFMGRLEPQKGLDRLPELFAGHVAPVHLRVLGDGPLREVVLAAEPSLPAGSTLELVSHTDDVWPHLDWCTALFLPSRWELNPMSVWEAWASGRPVVCSDLEVFRDLAGEGPALLFATSSELAGCIAQLGAESHLLEIQDKALEAVNRSSTSPYVEPFLAGTTP